MGTNLIGKSETVAEKVSVPVYRDGRIIDRLAADPGSMPVRTTEGMQITDSFGIHAAYTENVYGTPLTIEGTLMTDSTNIVLLYGKGQIILNWDRREDLLHVRHPATGQPFHLEGLGRVPTGRWHHVEWIIAEDVMRLLVDGEERYALAGNYRGLSGKVGVRTGWRANLQVGTLTVTEHLPADGRYASAGAPEKEAEALESLHASSGISNMPQAASVAYAVTTEIEQMRLTQGGLFLRGFRPLPHADSLLGCLTGALRYYNRYIEEAELMGTSGISFMPPVEPLTEAITFDRFAAAMKLLGIKLTHWNGKGEAVLAYIREAFAQEVPVIGRFAQNGNYAAVTACLAEGIVVEGSDCAGRFVPFDKLMADDVGLVTVRVSEAAGERERLAFACRLAGGVSAKNAEAYAKLMKELEGAEGSAEKQAAIIAAWRYNRESAVRFLERSGETVGLERDDLLSHAVSAYGTESEALVQAERLAAWAAKGEGGDEAWRTEAARAIEEAAKAERSGASHLGRLADILDSRKLLQELHYHCVSCMSPLNTFRGITDYYGIDCSDAWLKGATGRPFLFAAHERINVHDFCIPLPERKMIGLLGNIGLEIGGVEGNAQGEAYRKLLEQAWAAAREALDEGWACFGRAVDFISGEYTIIRGYDRDGYYTTSWHGPSEKTIPWTMYGLGQCPCGPCTIRRNRWREEGPVRTVCVCDDCRRVHQAGAYLSPQEEGDVRFYWAKPKLAADDRSIVRQALQLAVEFADPCGPWARPGMMTGASAYDALIFALEKGRYDGWYLGLHANGWKELRDAGWLFLTEAKERLADPSLAKPFDAAIRHAARLKDAFAKLFDMFPWMQPFGPIPDGERRYAGAELLRGAKEAEIGALQAYKELAELL